MTDIADRQLCGSCGAQSGATAKFCGECGARLAQVESAEYKQVTVLFADVVHSMEVAAKVGAERLREIMADLADRCAAVVRQFGGTVDKFTGDGIMAVFGAPVALEDHAIRACLAGLAIQEEGKQLAIDVQHRDGMELWLRVGLNSGQVIAGEIGSGSFGYTTIGEQVGMAQRMESVAPPGGVVLSASTVRLVDGAAVLGEPESVRIKGADEPVPARRLLGMRQDRALGRAESNLVGRDWEMSVVSGLLDRAIQGHGAVVGMVGPPGIGKSRLVRELSAMAASRGAEVFSTFCESHTTQIPFHAVAHLLRAGAEVEGLGAQDARDRLRERVSDADPEDLLLFDDLLGIADPDAVLPRIDPDARRRRLTALVNAASLARESPAVYVVEDAHWIDAVSESMLADFFTVIPQTSSLVIVTYRPEYEGVLTRVHGAHTVALAPLSDAETAVLIDELLGPDASVAPLSLTITERASGTPFFAEEIVRELAEQGVLRGDPGAYKSTEDVGEIHVPATLQATIAARIDRLDPKAKRTLSAAAVVGSRFRVDLLTRLGIEPDVTDLVVAQLIDQVTFTRHPEYVFHHPLIRAVAYEAQLKSDRAELHRRVANAIEEQSAGSLDENAALIAEHLEAAGDLPEAFGWHMRAATRLSNRDIVGARASWARAREVADLLPADDPGRMSMRIAPRTMLCATAVQVGGWSADIGFDELRALCTAAADQKSLAFGMAGVVPAEVMNAHRREASRLATELVQLLESIDDPTLTITLSYTSFIAKHETAEMGEILRFAQRVIDLADGDPTIGGMVFGSPLAFAIAMRGVALCCLGIGDWHADRDHAIEMVSSVGHAVDRATVGYYLYATAIVYGALLPDETALRITAENLTVAEQYGHAAFDIARSARAFTLVHCDGPERDAGFDLLAQVRERAASGQYSLTLLPIFDAHIAKEKARLGDLDAAIDLARSVVDDLSASGGSVWGVFAIAVLVESLVKRGGDGDLQDARTAIDRLATQLTDSGLVLHEIWLLRLRALLARACGDEATYQHLRDRYRATATSHGYEGHIKWAEAMT
jgi:class 3 adenylate cyclase